MRSITFLIANRFVGALSGLLLVHAGLAETAKATAAATPATAPDCLTAPAGLVGWWPGDKDENDIIGGNNASVVSAITVTPGEVSEGFTFDSKGYIEIPSSPSLANQQFTWAAWVRPDGAGPNNDSYGSVIVEQNSDSVGAAVWLSWRATDGRFIFGFGNLYSALFTSTDAFPSGAFYLVAATYDGSTFQLFVNGALEGSYAEVKTVPYSSSGWTIGSNLPIYFPSFARTWNGVIDEVQAFNRALSQSEIQAVYNAAGGGVCKGLTFSPAILRFPRRALGTTSPSESVTVTNAFPLAVAIKKVATNGDFAETNTCPVPPATLASGANCTASVTFTPTQPGTRTGKLTIANNSPASPQRVSLTGSGTDISLSATRLGFGSHVVGTTSRAKSVTATNVGSGLVTFTGSGIVLAGDDPEDYIISANTCGPALESGANCTVTIEFKPTAQGTRTATLDFNDDGGASPQTVALTGSGT